MISHYHHPSHWIGVAIVIALALLAFEASGQSTNAGAAFEGRPSMAGAQAGQGAQAGPAQGGIGLQGSDGAERTLRKPQIIEQQTNLPSTVACVEQPTQSATDKPLCLPEVGPLERRETSLGIKPQQR